MLFLKILITIHTALTWDFDIQYGFFENNLGETISKIYNFKQYKCEKNIENKKYISLKEEERKLLSTLKN